MKIVVLGTAYPFRGGIATYNERLARQFMAEGHEVEIWTFTLQYPRLLFPGKTQYSTSPAPEGLTIKRMLNSINPFNWFKVARQMRKLNPDLVLMRYWIPYMAPSHGVVARLVKRHCDTRFVSILDNVIPHEKRIGNKYFTQFFANSMDGFVAMSKTVLEDIKQFDKDKPKIFCRHPLYDSFGEKLSREDALDYLKLDKNQRYLLFFGIIRDYKGLDMLMRAMSLPEVKRLGLKLIVAGEFYNNAEQYYALEKEFGLEGTIVWHTRFIPDEEVRYYFSAADVLVQPYKSATQSGVTQVAYHFERPMIVTDVGGLKEMVLDGVVGYVTKPEPESVAKAIAEFYDNDRKETFEMNFKAEKQKYSWSNMTEAVLKAAKLIS